MILLVQDLTTAEPVYPSGIGLRPPPRATSTTCSLSKPSISSDCMLGIPNDDELALHRRAVAKLRPQLFARFSAADCYLVPDSEVILLPSVHITFDTVQERHHRHLALGGLRYFILAPRPHRAWIEAVHSERATFTIFTFHAEREDGATHTRLAMSREFSALPVEFHGAAETTYIESLAFEVQHAWQKGAWVPVPALAACGASA